MRAQRDELAASSLGAPGATVEQFLATARAGGCGAVELRCAAGQPVSTDLTPDGRARLRRSLDAAGLELLAVASYVAVCDPDPGVPDDLVAHVQLALDLGARAVRVFPGAGDAPSHEADARAVERLRGAAPVAAAADVHLALETHDSHARGEDVARVLTALDAAAPGHGVSVVWDVLHPWRRGEAPSRTAEVLRPWLGWVQVKDAAGPPGVPEPVLMGEGVLPLADVADALGGIAYAGWLSLEWEKAWFPDAPDLDGALASARRWVEATRGRRRGQR